jgi:hypothetical protein
VFKRRLVLAGALGASLSTGLTACYTLQEAPPAELPAAGGQRVMLVGRIELVPRLAVGEQDIDIKNDVFNVKRHMQGRAVMYMANRPDPGSLQVLSAEILNPVLDQTFFFLLTRSERFISKGGVTMEWRDLTANSKAMNLEKVELNFPTPLEIDVRPDDQAIYLGSLRMYRDPYHTLLKTELLDNYPTALAEFRQRFGAQATLRKALLKLPG